MQTTRRLEVVVVDVPEECPYVPGRVARLPLRLPLGTVSPTEVDERLAQGERRGGAFWYRPTCPSCQSCQALRLPVARFAPRRTQRRVESRGDQLLQVVCLSPRVDRERLALFNRHRSARGLSVSPATWSDYQEFLVVSCCETLELDYYLGENLVAVAICDRGERALSAVYCYFDPARAWLSLGTYSILKQVALCRAWQLDYLYLGLYNLDAAHLRYKAQFGPHERFLDGVWQ